jgi:hypothetical protein
MKVRNGENRMSPTGQVDDGQSGFMLSPVDEEKSTNGLADLLHHHTTKDLPPGLFRHQRGGNPIGLTKRNKGGGGAPLGLEGCQQTDEVDYFVTGPAFGSISLRRRS